MSYTENDLQKLTELLGVKRKNYIDNLIAREENRLRIEAQKSPDSAEAFKRIPSQKKEYRKKLLSDLKEYKQEKGSDLGELGKLTEIVNMNITHEGDLITAGTIANTELTGQLEIQNPNAAILDSKEFKEVLATGGTVANNLNRIKRILVESTRKTEQKDIKLGQSIQISKFLGAVDTSSAKIRKDVYDYWKGIANDFPKVIQAAKDFLEAIKQSNLPDEMKSKFEEVFDINNFVRLQYIVEFPMVEKNLLKPRHRFFNLVAAMISAENLFDNLSVTGEKEVPKSEIDQSEYGDVTGALMAEMLQGIKDSEYGGTTVNQWTGTAEIDDPKMKEAMMGDDIEWVKDVDSLMSQADPLIMYETVRNKKLVAVTKEGLTQLTSDLDQLIDAIEDGQFKVSLDYQTDLEEWADQLEDSVSLDQTSGFFLPISVLGNKDFDSLYDEDKFPAPIGFEPTDLASLEDIKEFFDDLYELIVEDMVTMVKDIRTTKGQKSRGTDMKTTFRSRKQRKKLDRAVESQFDITLPQRGGGINELFGDDVKGKLEIFIQECVKYYFNPAYTGRLPIQTPNFVGTVGGRVIQILSADIGLDTVMSGAYQKMTKSKRPVKVKDLKSIANFLDNIFLKSFEIDTTMITQGERAAKAMSNIFGKNTLERNNNYFAALLHHFMEKTQDTERQDDDFNGKSILERKKEFDVGYKNREAYPIFAMPFFLDINQGILTQKKNSKDQYNRLKNIFETVQPDLSVLIHKMLEAHDAIRQQMNLPTVFGFFPLNQTGYDAIIEKMYKEENVDLSNYEVENIIKAVDSHENISKEYGISSEQVYLIKAHFR